MRWIVGVLGLEFEGVCDVLHRLVVHPLLPEYDAVHRIGVATRVVEEYRPAYALLGVVEVPLLLEDHGEEEPVPGDVGVRGYRLPDECLSVVEAPVP